MKILIIKKFKDFDKEYHFSWKNNIDINILSPNHATFHFFRFLKTLY